ncbi:MAG: response regulator [Fimbriimonas ginsengisoli]|uniref:Response regulator n=1 Tax=Fimbriimonas ginsengisoli TaxID=1005039 RepID=A0A931LRG5_FIMGI|nr:response regulator [Fimbriimonas ginsengisoli]MBI3721343.1 response regulator [Fimbriimonas ginsengisoli]
MSEKILIVDDEANIRTMMRLALESVGYVVETAADGEEGLRKLSANGEVDLVLLDQRMPGLSGIEVQLKIAKTAPNTRVILITAFGTIDLALEAIQAGASDFMRKPFTADTLRSTVRASLDKPIERRLAVPIGLVVKEFTRTTFNGFRFDSDDEPESESGHKDANVTARFLVRQGEAPPAKVKVILPTYIQELVKTHIDADTVPGGDSFWQALCEEALANYLWQNAQLPEGGVLRIEDLSSGLQRWLDTMSTVETGTQHARN